MTNAERIAQAVKFAGNQRKLADLLGVSHTSVYTYVRDAWMPHRHRIKLEQLTRHSMRPLRAVEWDD